MTKRKINEATAEQWAEVQRIADRCIAAQTERVPHERVRSAVHAVWAMMDRPAPMVLVAPSPRCALVWAAVVQMVLGDEGKRGQLDTKLLAQLRDQLGAQLDTKLLAQLHATLTAQLRAQLDDQLDGQLHGQLRAQLLDQLDAPLQDKLNGQLDAQLDGQLDAQLQLRDQLTQLRDQLDAQLDGQLRDQLSGQLRGQLFDQLRDQLGEQLRDQLTRQLRAQLDGQLGDQLGEQLRAQLRDQLFAQLSTKLRDQPIYWSIWWRVWSAWYEAGAALGVQFDPHKYRTFREWATCCPFVVPYAGLVVVAENPTEIHWLDRILHREDGPAVRYADGWALWMLQGVRCDERIVMHPETITVDEIRTEEHAERRRILRQRYGEGRYLIDTGATIVDVDHETCRKGAAPRMLVDDGDSRWLVGTDGSTQRVYYMPVDPSIRTCRAAHESLCGFPEDRIINKS